MITDQTNPFNELYVTETIQAEQFVKMFSPLIVKNSAALFQPGNVVLKGVQGSGKSMLLGLLKPEIRIAYHKVGVRFPLTPSQSKFIGAGINLTRSGAIDFGQRSIQTGANSEAEVLPLYFADFLNFWLVSDLLQSIETYIDEAGGVIGSELGIVNSPSLRDKFAEKLSNEHCWFGSLNGVTNYSDLVKRLQDRIRAYRSYLNFNSDVLDESITRTKTAIGEPLSKTAELLWKSGLVPRDVSFFARIDQYEELCRLEDWSKDLNLKYRRIVNKALGTRDPYISYRVGARRYAWQDDLKIYGTESSLEVERDYKVVDIDEILRRKEDTKTWVFPRFAEDVFERRLKISGYSQVRNTSMLSEVFGDGLSSEDIALQYVKSSYGRVIDLDSEWPAEWKVYLTDLAEHNPLSAKLGESWLRQTTRRVSKVALPAAKEKPPWEQRVYWKKERVQQALMQIAARCSQRMVWAGRDSILALSGGNILVFVSICQQIWAAWTRTTRNERQIIPGSISFIPPPVQAVGIHLASTYWYNKIPEQTGGNQRQKFIDRIGRIFQERLASDKAMSYPGHNGFSLTKDELESDNGLHRFLNDAVDYGDLFDSLHTTKLKDRRQRKKWYLKPVLSPHFRVPVSHVKEPMYVTRMDVHQWLSESGVSLEGAPSLTGKLF